MLGAVKGWVEAYRLIKPDAFGLKVSQDRRRVEIRGVGKVSVKVG